MTQQSSLAQFGFSVPAQEPVARPGEFDGMSPEEVRRTLARRERLSRRALVLDDEALDSGDDEEEDEEEDEEDEEEDEEDEEDDEEEDEEDKEDGNARRALLNDQQMRDADEEHAEVSEAVRHIEARWGTPDPRAMDGDMELDEEESVREPAEETVNPSDVHPRNHFYDDSQHDAEQIVTDGLVKPPPILSPDAPRFDQLDFLLDDNVHWLFSHGKNTYADHLLRYNEPAPLIMSDQPEFDCTDLVREWGDQTKIPYDLLLKARLTVEYKVAKFMNEASEPEWDVANAQHLLYSVQFKRLTKCELLCYLEFMTRNFEALGGENWRNANSVPLEEYTFDLAAYTVYVRLLIEIYDHSDRKTGASYRPGFKIPSVDKTDETETGLQKRLKLVQLCDECWKYCVAGDVTSVELDAEYLRKITQLLIDFQVVKTGQQYFDRTTAFAFSLSMKHSHINHLVQMLIYHKYVDESDIIDGVYKGSRESFAAYMNVLQHAKLIFVQFQKAGPCHKLNLFYHNNTPAKLKSHFYKQIESVCLPQQWTLIDEWNMSGGMIWYADVPEFKKRHLMEISISIISGLGYRFNATVLDKSRDGTLTLVRKIRDSSLEFDSIAYEPFFTCDASLKHDPLEFLYQQFEKQIKNIMQPGFLANCRLSEVGVRNEFKDFFKRSDELKICLTPYLFQFKNGVLSLAPPKFHTMQGTDRPDIKIFTRSLSEIHQVGCYRHFAGVFDIDLKRYLETTPSELGTEWMNIVPDVNINDSGFKDTTGTWKDTCWMTWNMTQQQFDYATKVFTFGMIGSILFIPSTFCDEGEYGILRRLAQAQDETYDDDFEWSNKKWEFMPVFFGLPGTGKTALFDWVINSCLPGGGSSQKELDLRHGNPTFQLGGCTPENGVRIVTIGEGDSTTTKNHSAFSVETLGQMISQECVKMEQKGKNEVTEKFNLYLIASMNSLPTDWVKAISDKDKAGFHRRIKIIYFQHRLKDGEKYFFPESHLFDQWKDTIRAASIQRGHLIVKLFCAFRYLLHKLSTDPAYEKDLSQVNQWKLSVCASSSFTENILQTNNWDEIIRFQKDENNQRYLQKHVFLAISLHDICNTRWTAIRSKLAECLKDEKDQKNLYNKLSRTVCYRIGALGQQTEIMMDEMFLYLVCKIDMVKLALKNLLPAATSELSSAKRATEKTAESFLTSQNSLQYELSPDRQKRLPISNKHAGNWDNQKYIRHHKTQNGNYWFGVCVLKDAEDMDTVEFISKASQIKENADKFLDQLANIIAEIMPQTCQDVQAWYYSKIMEEDEDDEDDE